MADNRIYLNNLNTFLPALNKLINDLNTSDQLMVNSIRMITNLIVASIDTNQTEEEVKLIGDNLNLNHLVNRLSIINNQKLRASSVNLAHQILRLFGCLMLNSSELVGTLMKNHDFVSCLSNLLDKSQRLLIKEACWIISILTSQTDIYFQASFMLFYYTKCIS
mgnify:CR=1 FL=1